MNKFCDVLILKEYSLIGGLEIKIINSVKNKEFYKSKQNQCLEEMSVFFCFQKWHC